ncbi:D-lyxose/D-mannose family sugar isomerase [uncultured Roseobacter sp.]|uniref:D-lyxose/D-mannose family sugar isomerase n=1 Tax=uncultured Roseobacter sp. TaxID=114847 RepID=UPI00262876E4|nr:D-lyxose/D-mannose family sugar isomerase [uncultured Roseobacter sp.]
MKRSEINTILQEADAFIRSFGYRMPAFAYWSPDEMLRRRDDIRGITTARLGWDITDYGAGDFDNMGLFLFTTRNGSLAELQAGGGMCYAEKIMISRHNQISPMHRHVLKTEDIINRGGATLAIEMFESAPDGSIDRDAPVPVACDGMLRTLAPGDVLKLAPGESVTLRPGNWHKFWGEGGDVLIGEVSAVNDDLTDNIFEQEIGRFADIDEDTGPVHLLVSDYEAWGLIDQS